MNEIPVRAAEYIKCPNCGTPNGVVAWKWRGKRICTCPVCLYDWETLTEAMPIDKRVVG